MFFKCLFFYFFIICFIDFFKKKSYFRHTHLALSAVLVGPDGLKQFVREGGHQALVGSVPNHGVALP